MYSHPVINCGTGPAPVGERSGPLGEFPGAGRKLWFGTLKDSPVPSARMTLLLLGP